MSTVSDVLAFLDFYGPTTLPVLDLAVNPLGSDPEGLLQLLDHLERERLIVSAIALMPDSISPIVIIQRI